MLLIKSFQKAIPSLLLVLSAPNIGEARFPEGPPGECIYVRDLETDYTEISYYGHVGDVIIDEFGRVRLTEEQHWWSSATKIVKGINVTTFFWSGREWIEWSHYEGYAFTKQIEADGLAHPSVALPHGCGNNCNTEKAAISGQCGGENLVNWSNWYSDSCTGATCIEPFSGSSHPGDCIYIQDLMTDYSHISQYGHVGDLIVDDSGVVRTSDEQHWWSSPTEIRNGINVYTYFWNGMKWEELSHFTGYAFTKAIPSNGSLPPFIAQPYGCPTVILPENNYGPPDDC